MESISLPVTLKALLDHPLLTEDQETQLALKSQAGCSISRFELVRCNARLVYTLSRKFTPDPGHVPEYFSAGMLGLIIAAKGYNPAIPGVPKARFATYAVHPIRQQMSILKRRIFTGAASVTELGAFRLRAIKSKLRQSPDLTPESIALQLRIPPIKIISLLEICQARSFDAPLAHGDPAVDLHDLATSDDLAVPVLLEKDESHASLLEAVHILPKKSRDILCCRYGLHGYPVENLREIGDRFGLTSERIRQIEENALKLLRARLTRPSAI